MKTLLERGADIEATDEVSQEGKYFDYASVSFTFVSVSQYISQPVSQSLS